MKLGKIMWPYSLKLGLGGGVVAILLALIGMVESFHQRHIISEIASMGQTLLACTALFFSYLAARKTTGNRFYKSLSNGIICGLLFGISLALLVKISTILNLRAVFINASPLLFKILTFSQGTEKGEAILIISGSCLGLLGGCFFLAPPLWRRVFSVSLGSVILIGVLQDLLRPTFALWGPLAILNDWLYTANGLTRTGAAAIFILAALLAYIWANKKEAWQATYQSLKPGQKKAAQAMALVLFLFILLALPQILGLFLSEVLTIVGLYVLLGLGLNIVVGYAGLLDLGYVAFFAIGAYSVALLTSPELGFMNLTFWQALPLAIVCGVVSGVLLGIPVLKMRGDYLAIATLGFGEIIRILVLSDFLRPWLGGAQGIGKIPKPFVGSVELSSPQEIYYLILGGCFLVAFISWRLRDSRLGRAWMAIREDEDVAQAMGINLVSTKLLAFATGAGFSALSGAIFASKLGSVYPHSFNVMISINILCLIIVGGMGSIPGVIVGAFALVGLPELLREFAEYRLLVYGAALVAMMLYRPEGLWPEPIHRRELHSSSSG
ncbi:MAG: branched-chain amino acid ABC transporter permease [Thermodesulfobacteriota bacterium]